MTQPHKQCLILDMSLLKTPDVQERLQREIDAAFEANDNNFPTYNTIQSMEYMDMVFYEALRLHIGFGGITRAAVADYTIPGTNIHLKKGDELLFNLAGIHADKEYYPKPTEFNPEHFNKENKAKRHP